MTTKQPTGKNWFKIGEVGVDSGMLMITDPCYVSNFKDDRAPNRNIVVDTVTGIKWQFCYGGEPDAGCSRMPGTYDGILPGTNMTFNAALAAGRLRELPKPDPDNEYSYRGCCDITCSQPYAGGLKFAMGHMGQGVVFSSGYGDGVYEVWGRKNAEGRIAEVRILMA